MLPPRGGAQCRTHERLVRTFLTMNDLHGQAAELSPYRIYLGLQVRHLVLKFSNLCLKARIFRLQLTIAVLKFRYALILYVHEHNPYLYWF